METKKRKRRKPGKDKRDRIPGDICGPRRWGSYPM